MSRIAPQKWSDATVPLQIVRAAAWAWLAGAAGLAILGGVAVYREPSILRIDEFARLYDLAGLSDRTMMTIVLVLPFVCSWVAAAFIAWRRPDDGGALTLSVGIVSLYFFISGLGHGIEPDWLSNGAVSLAVVMTAVLLVTVPTGTFVPRWSMLAPALVVVITTARPELAVATRRMLGGASEMGTFDRQIATFGWGLILATAITAQVVRYRRLSTTLEQHQSRWLFLGALSLIVPPVVLLGILLVGVERDGWVAGLVLVTAAGSFLFPATMLVAVFRHHLFEIDRIISRTVTFALVAMVIGGVYATTVLVLTAAINGPGDLVVAGSTLSAAAVFNPARRRIQGAVDRRFNRSRYNADHEVDEFSNRLGTEVTLDAVTDQVRLVLARTLQPSATEIWIRTRS